MKDAKKSMKDLLINNLEIARKQEQLNGEIDLACFERLLEVTVNQDSSQKIKYELTGTQAKFHLPSLHLTIDAVLPVTCQRCLESMQLALSLNFDYVLSASEPDEFAGDENIDWLEASQDMNLNDLIEDELLMAVPLAPVHEHACESIKYEAGEKHNPFDVLQKLKKKP